MITTLLPYLLYAAIALVWMAMRGMQCQHRHEYFDVAVELLGAMIWPVTAVWWIAISVARTRRYARPWR